MARLVASPTCDRLVASPTCDRLVASPTCDMQVLNNNNVNLSCRILEFLRENVRKKNNVNLPTIN